jgi:RNA polymerase sigma-70 factor (ECF subfamily)
LIPSGVDETSVKIDLKSVEPNDLVRRLLSGCSESATELSNRFMPRLLILLERRLSGRRTDAEDIAQESLARAFLQIDKFDFRFQFSTWLYTIAFRLATDFTRKEKRRPKLVAMDAVLHAPEIASSHTSRNASAVVDDVWRLAHSILVESQYTILWLKYGESLSIKEIASVVQKTEIMVRVQLHRARSKLAKEINRMDRETMTTRSNAKQVL